MITCNDLDSVDWTAAGLQGPPRLRPICSEYYTEPGCSPFAVSRTQNCGVVCGVVRGVVRGVVAELLLVIMCNDLDSVDWTAAGLQGPPRLRSICSEYDTEPGCFQFALSRTQNVTLHASVVICECGNVVW